MPATVLIVAADDRSFSRVMSPEYQTTGRLARPTSQQTNGRLCRWPSQHYARLPSPSGCRGAAEHVDLEQETPVTNWRELPIIDALINAAPGEETFEAPIPRELFRDHESLDAWPSTSIVK